MSKDKYLTIPLINKEQHDEIIQKIKIERNDEDNTKPELSSEVEKIDVVKPHPPVKMQRSSSYTDNFNHKHFTRPSNHTPPKFKPQNKNLEILNSQMIPDSPTSDHGMIIEVYRLQGSHPKIRIRRYITNESGEIYSNPNHAIRITSMHSIRNFYRTITSMNNMIEDIVDEFKKQNTNRKMKFLKEKYESEKKGQ